MSETSPIIAAEDITALQSSSDIFGLFKKLRYRVEDGLRMPFEVLELPGRHKDFIKENGRAIYLISNYDHLFQIYLFETTDLRLTPIKDICRSFSRKQGDYLLLFSTDYSEILFVNLLERQTGIELRRLRLNTRREKPYHTDLQIINSLALPQPDINPFDIYDLQCKAFRKERVTDDFYKAYKNVFEDVRQSLGKVKSDAHAHAFTQILMNRLMLLYFVQQRGWLNNNPNFLKEFYDTYREDKKTNKLFYHDYLEPLFFGAFNRENGFDKLTVPDSVKETLKNAPYLNGGMFLRINDIEPHGITITDDSFDLMFDRLFERYNFIVKEDTPLDIELAIDPELLGNVYQRLVSEEERGQAGIFYTQPTEVNFMCQRAVIEYLSRHIPGKRPDIIRLVMNYLDPPGDLDLPWDMVEKQLSEVKICDPACGSGAFLVAMMHLLIDIRGLSRKNLGNKTDIFELKKEIISQNLYGVDVKAHAARIAELRLWLSLIVDAPDDFVQKHPDDPVLPNLSYRILQGDSLIEEFAGKPLHLRGEYEITEKRIPQIIRKVYDLEDKIFHGKVKSTDLGKIKAEHQKLKKELFQGILKDRMQSIRGKIGNLEMKLRLKQPPTIQGGLFEKAPEQIRIDFRKEINKEIADLNAKLAEYRQLLESEDFGKLSERDYVLWEIDFAEVFMKKGGFDIIIGNPPYVRQEEICPPAITDRPTTREERKAYKDKLIQSVQAYAGRQLKVDKKSDLYIYFYYLGMSLLNKDGVFVFITSNSWLDVGYGAGLQEWLLNNMEIADIYDNQARRSFRSADVNTVIVVFNKPEGNPLSHTARFTAFKKSFEDVLSSDNLLAIEEAKGIVSTDDFRIYQAAQQELLEEGFEKEKKQKEIGKFIPMAGKYKGNKWGGKYLRAPDIYFKILEKAGDKLVRLGDIAEVRFGIKTGCNQFFYFDDAKIKEWGIEEEFLKPVIFSLKEINFIEDDLNGLQYKAFMCHLPKSILHGTRALKYIEWGEAQGFNKRPTCRSRRSWYSIGKGWKAAPLIFPAKVGERMLVLNNKKRVLEDKKLYGITPQRGTTTYWAFILNSTLTRFFMDLSCRQLTGAQAIADIDVRVTENIDILPPEFFDEYDFEPIYNNFVKRPIFAHVTDEYNQPDRRALDNIIFDILGLTEGERDTVYEAVVELVRNRLEKARSV